MAYTFNLKSLDADELAVAFIRNEIDDESGSPAGDGGQKGVNYFLSDERITAFRFVARDIAPDDASETEINLWAAAAAEETLAKNQAFVLKKQTTLGESDDGPAVAKAIREHAAELSARAWKSLTDRRKKAAEQAAANAAQIQEPRGGAVWLVPML